ncbi:MAG: hypothetical protein EHM58_18835 [Ignavibacteriae bacterium]|nr:MAG: hypothetical protein EHM58_18835 [Ignavibacteriota bacterium]
MFGRIVILFIKASFGVVMLMLAFVLFRSALDIYNTFAYDKALVKDSPYGSVPMLEDPKNWRDNITDVKSGDFVYVEDWLVAYNNRVSFAKVKSKLNSGYMNQDLLVHAKTNIKPVISVIILSILLIVVSYKIIKKFINYNIVYSTDKNHFKKIYS